MFDIPTEFAQRMIVLLGEQGPLWLKRLPAILTECERRWELSIEPPFALSYNYVAPARRRDGTPVIVKVCTPEGEFRQQEEALELINGQGCARLLAYDQEMETMLLERLVPGTLLSSLENDELETSIAASVMRQIWRPISGPHNFPTVQDWGKGFVRLRKRFSGGSGPFEPALLSRAETLFRELSASMAEPALLHGDLHHENILAATRQPWLAIDPKGLVGEPAYETGAQLRNKLARVFTSGRPGRSMARRVDQLAAELGMERERIRDWGIAQAVLSAWWGIEDFGELHEGDREALACAELLANMRI
ncbi:aminoglycoside/hydroxyurea antibiotic resistance kinase [Ktedonosporobacter rubrisoli]|uniref:Aminoglycoside/hydroxyurea antibiotic resistance kinase n=1 Tax=Ktedonosporobacter rubrisoli TaxID=2509675 RepID=A0A4V0YZL3_KTERU|nr:aminoglycoside phosphotransferase family protein [Ktedonosporobacter rubrisoli]QBD80121.1 aminoglycoside/hydroxyurea antibiotic resistance kinase [Ktedonosporobacter rubrisoli]